MREIKFRGKLVTTGEWVYWYPYWTDGKVKLHIETCANKIKINGMDIDQNTIGQYVVLKDRQGNEIYEGDILEVEGWNSRDNNWKKVFEVVFSDAMFCLKKDNEEYSFFGQREGDVQLKKSKVVGNIYDSPELLQEEQ